MRSPEGTGPVSKMNHPIEKPSKTTVMWSWRFLRLLRHFHKVFPPVREVGEEALGKITGTERQKEIEAADWEISRFGRSVFIQYKTRERKQVYSLLDS